MPASIVADRAMAPICTLSPGDVAGLVDQLATYHAHLALVFARTDQAAWAHLYLQGLLGDCQRKSINSKSQFQRLEA